MKFHTKIYLLLISIVFISCDKHYAKKLAGDYDCIVHSEYTSVTYGPSDTTYQETITITREEDNIVIFDHSIQVDELRKGQEYRENGYSYSYFKVSINDGVLNYYSIGGGLGGSSSITIVGNKE